MAAALSAALATDGLWLLLTGVVLAGLVRGFSGFGTAMVYVPFAAQVLPPVWVLVTMVVIDVFGPIPAIPRALRDGHRRDVLRLGAGALLGVPLGVLVLTSLPSEAFRYAVSAVTGILLVFLVSGLRYRGPVPAPLIYGTGAIGGLLGGSVGVAGPPVILLYMARPLPVATIRANIMLYLILGDLLMFAVFGVRGLLDWQPVLLGAGLMLPYLASLWIGARIFDSSRETVYRWVAYAIIAGSALNGLPVWD